MTALGASITREAATVPPGAPAPVAAAERRRRSAPLLLTPGPLTTARAVKHAMLHDYGTRDAIFREVTRSIRANILSLAGAGPAWTCVPLQGSGTYAIEAAVGTFVPSGGKLLALCNGAYGRRIVEIATRIGRPACSLDGPEDQPTDIYRLEEILRQDQAITHVALVHCETTSGVLNPLADVAQIVQQHGRKLLVDAMSSFGALTLELDNPAIVAVVSSSNKCIEGVPGVAFCLSPSAELACCAGQAHSIALDLHAQWRSFEQTGEWRFTPPVQVLLALHEAIKLLVDEGGPAARLERYSGNLRVLIDGMTALGLRPYLAETIQSPIIATFHNPPDPRFQFEMFYDIVKGHGFLLYPGKVTQAATFRVGCIGNLGPADMRAAVDAIARALSVLGVAQLSP